MPKPDKVHLRGVRNTPLQWFANALPAIALASCALAIALIIPIAAITGRGYGFFTRDPTIIGQIPYYAGYVSSLGVLSWTTGAAVAIFSSVVLDALEAERLEATFFFYFGCLTLLLTLDDLFLIHENVPNEKVIFLAYLLIALAGCILFRKQFQRHATGFAITAASAFFLSLAIDSFQHLIQERIGYIRIVLEDGAKFFGCLCWTIFLCKASAASILDVRRQHLLDR